jgi:hypothetical protein
MLLDDEDFALVTPCLPCGATDGVGRLDGRERLVAVDDIERRELA